MEYIFEELRSAEPQLLSFILNMSGIRIALVILDQLDCWADLISLLLQEKYIFMDAKINV